MEGGCKAARLLSQYIMFNILTKIAMKKKLFLSASAVLAAFAAFSLAGCQKDETGDGSDQDSGTSPVLVITTEDNMDIPAAGGPVSITYRIDNAVPGSTVSASCPETVNWVNGFDTETSGTVSFTVAANTDTESRSALITLTCTWGDGETVSDDVTVIQAAADPEPVNPPVITATMAPKQNLPYTGNDAIIAYYNIENSVDDGVVSLSMQPEVDWVTVTETYDNRIVFAVSENTGSEERTVTIRLRYTYGGKYVESEQTMEIVQVGVPVQGVDYEFVATEFTGEYTPGFANIMPATFNLKLSSSSDASLTYNVLLSADTDASSDKTIPSGDYIYGDYGAAGIFGYDDTYVKFEDETTKVIIDGSIHVVNNGNGTYEIDANFVDADNKTHHVTFSGAASF